MPREDVLPPPFLDFLIIKYILYEFKNYAFSDFPDD